jgi:hypothetical protein
MSSKMLPAEAATAPVGSGMVQPVRWLHPFKVVALIAAYNEADIVGTVVSDLIDQGVMVYFLDHCSTDGTVEVVQPYMGNGVIAIERFPADGVASDNRHGFEWERILKRKEMLASELDAHWFIHHDADEFRESPWADRSLAEAIKTVDRFGYNAIDFQVFNFFPTHNRFRPGRDPRKAFPCYATGESFNKVQVRCWKKISSAVDIASKGGHDATFPGRRVFPIRFILRHYPIRGQQHGERKVFAERRAGFVAAERARGWHVQYDGILEGDSFVRDPDTLTRFDPDAVRLKLMLEHRGVEELEARTHAAERLAADLGARQVSEQRLIDTLNREIARLANEVLVRSREAERLFGIIETSQREGDHLRAELDLRHRDAQKLATLADERAHEIERLTSAATRSESETQRLTGALAQSEGEAQRLTGALAQSEGEAQRLTGALAESEDEVRRLAGALAQSESEVHRLAGALAQADARARSLIDALAMAEGEVDRLSGTVRQHETEALRVADELSSVTSRRAVERADLDAATRQVDVIGIELRRAHAEIESLSSATASLRGELDAALRRNETLVDEVAAARYHVAALLSSASWRWMAPLRAAKRTLMRLER